MDRRQLPEDFKEFIIFLNENEVQYLLVGGWAVGLYGTPRATKDIDFLIAVDDDSYKRRNIITIQNVPVSVISKEDLIKNKKASARYQDLADAENLENC